MSVTPLITPAEADSYNALSADWLALATAEKEAHIYNSSVYMQNHWSCTDVDWDDALTLDDDLKRACAYYAEADRIGVLFDEMIKEEVHGMKTMEKKKLGTMEKTLEWSMFGSPVNGNPLAGVDAIMRLYCTSTVGSATLLRV